MSVSQAAKHKIELDETQMRDLKLGILLGMGFKGQDAAEVLGCSHRTIYNREQGVNVLFIADISGFVSRQQDMNRTAYMEIAKERATEHLEKMLPKVVRNIEQSLDTKNPALRYKSAVDTLRQLIGLPGKGAAAGSGSSGNRVFRVTLKTIQAIHDANGSTLQMTATEGTIEQRQLPLPERIESDE